MANRKEAIINETLVFPPILPNAGLVLWTPHAAS